MPHPEFDAWLATNEVERVVLLEIEAQPHSAPLTTVTYRAGSTEIRGSNGHYLPILLHDYQTSEGDDGLGVSFRSAGVITLMNRDGRVDDWLDSEPNQVTVYLGSREWDIADYYTEVYQCLGWDDADEEVLYLHTSAFGRTFDVGILTNRFTTGQQKERLKPKFYGRVWYHELLQISDDRYQLHDGPSGAETDIAPHDYGLDVFRYKNTGSTTPSSNDEQEVNSAGVVLSSGLTDLTDYGPPLWVGVGAHGASGPLPWPGDPREVVRRIIEQHTSLTLDESFDVDQSGIYQDQDFSMQVALPITTQASIRDTLNRVLQPFKMWITNNPDGSVRFGHVQSPITYPVFEGRYNAYFTFNDVVDEVIIEMNNHGFDDGDTVYITSQFGWLNGQYTVDDFFSSGNASRRNEFTVVDGAGSPGDEGPVCVTRVSGGTCDPVKVLRNPADVQYTRQQPIKKVTVEPENPDNKVPVSSGPYDFDIVNTVSAQFNSAREEIIENVPVAWMENSMLRFYDLANPGLGHYVLTVTSQPETLGWRMGDFFVCYDERFNLSAGRWLQVLNIEKYPLQGSGTTVIRAFG